MITGGKLCLYFYYYVLGIYLTDFCLSFCLLFFSARDELRTRLPDGIKNPILAKKLNSDDEVLSMIAYINQNLSNAAPVFVPQSSLGLSLSNSSNGGGSFGSKLISNTNNGEGSDIRGASGHSIHNYSNIAAKPGHKGW